jgi:salicylate hydroxylase
MDSQDLKGVRIAVIGGGYGGACAAKALSQTGADVNLYEQATAIREVGAGIGLRPSSMEQFRQWGIFDAIAAVSSPSDYFEILTATGEPIISEPWPGIDDYDPPTKTHLIHRGDFIDALIGVLPPEMVHLGHKAAGIEDHGDSATVTFANGTSVTADLVVGADGIRSTIREQLFSSQQPVFAGEHAYRVVVPADATYGLAKDDNFRMYIGRGTKVYFLPLRHRGDVSYDVTSRQDDPTPNPVRSKDHLVSLLEGFDDRLVQIARELDMDQVNIRAVYDIDPVDTWHSDSVALLGDAAHAMCHHQGQGANSAILDAGGLADALREASSVKEALALYQATRKPMTDELQRISRQGWDDEEPIDDVFPGQKAGAK